MKYFIQRNKRLFLLLTVLVVSFFLISYSMSRPPETTGLNPLESAIVWAVSPFQQGVSTILHALEVVWFDYLGLLKTRERDELLRERIGRLEAEVSRLREKAAVTDRLTELLQYRDSSPSEARVSRIIGADGTGYSRTITLDRGTSDGLALDMPVVTPRGVVGRVVKVHQGYSQALLLVDLNSAIDALVQRTRDKGIVVGSGARGCEMKYVDRQADVRTGDLIVTSGLTGMFPPGLVLGEVIEAEKEGPGLFQTVKVRPAVEIDRLEEVLVLVRPKG